MSVPEQGIDLRANLTGAERQVVAWRDVADGLAAYRLAWTLGWLDIKLRYRGSILGPFWLTLSTAIMVLSMGLLYAELFHMEMANYLPYLAMSLILWNSLGGVVGEACTCFTAAEGTIRSLRMPFTLYAARTVVRNLLILLHNVVVIVAVFAWYDAWPGPAALASLAGLAVWMVDGLAACLLLGAFCARFRDVAPIVGSVMQIAFFLTPIIWKPELIGGNAALLVFNPFYPLLAVVRDPLLGTVPGGALWAAALAWSAMLLVAGWILFARVRGRLAFWV